METGKDTLTEFMEALNAVKEYAAVKGTPITMEDIKQYFKGIALDKDKLDIIYGYIANAKMPDSDTISDKEEAVERKYISPKDYEKDKAYIKMYMKDLEKIEPLSDTTRAFLLVNIVEDNDMQSLKILTESMLGKVVAWIEPYQNQGVLTSDLIQEANLAMTGYMSDKRFLHHESWKEKIKEGSAQDLLQVLSDIEEEIVQEITGAVQMMVDEQSQSDRLAGRVLNKVNYVNDWAFRLREELGRKPTIEELADKTGIGVEQVMEAIGLSGDKIEHISNRGVQK